MTALTHAVRDAVRLPGLGRRAVCRAAAAGAMLGSVPGWMPGTAQAVATPPAGVIPFSVYRSGARIGHHRTRFTDEAGGRRVDVEVRLAVTFAGITVFRYSHDSVEHWRDGRLAAIDSETDDDGRHYRVHGRSEDGVFRVLEGRSGAWEAPAGIIPTSYWHIGTVHNTRLLHTAYGEPFDVSTQRLGDETIAAAGRRIEADRYRLTASLIVDAWYNAADQWVKLAFSARGSDIEYVLDPGAPNLATEG